MVIHVTKVNDAVRLLQGQYFHVAGDAACTRRPTVKADQIYNNEHREGDAARKENTSIGRE
jgi:hypothetical protein